MYSNGVWSGRAVNPTTAATNDIAMDATVISFLEWRINLTP
jgi:hypothetical protein